LEVVSLRESKVEKIDSSLGVKACKFYKNMEGIQVSGRCMLNSGNTRKLLVKVDNTQKSKRVLFEIQIGLERDGPLLKKEVLWKK